MRACPLEISAEDQARFQEVIQRGSTTARIQTRARILLLTEAGWSNEQMVAALHVCPATITHTRQRYRVGGIERVLHDQVQEKRRQALTGEGEALVVALEVGESSDHTTIGHLLKKTNSSHGNTNTGV